MSSIEKSVISLLDKLLDADEIVISNEEDYKEVKIRFSKGGE